MGQDEQKKKGKITQEQQQHMLSCSERMAECEEGKVIELNVCSKQCGTHTDTHTHTNLLTNKCSIAIETALDCMYACVSLGELVTCFAHCIFRCAYSQNMRRRLYTTTMIDRSTHTHTHKHRLHEKQQQNKFTDVKTNTLAWLAYIHSLQQLRHNAMNRASTPTDIANLV